MAHNHHEHHHGHKHLHAHGGLKGQVILIIVTILLFIGAVLIEKNCNLPTWQLLLVYLVPYLLVGYHTLAEAAEGILGGDIFNEHFLMSIATIGALCIGFFPGAETEFPEAVFVMLFFQIGELFENYAEGKSRGSISHLMDIRPDVANVEIGGKLVTVSPENVNVGDIIVIKPGEKVPLDGKIIDGTSSLNTIALTGESMPRDLSVGDDVISGCVNLTGVIRVKTTKDFGESTVSKIIELVESADEHKSKSESFITKFAHVYTPIVVIAALLLAVIPPLFSSVGFAESFPAWFHRALIFLVVSCPCALVISVPLSFFGGIGGASKCGVLIKGSNYLENLAKTRTVVFDKTGTLTKGEFKVTEILPQGCSEEELLELAALGEGYSNHPIAGSIKEAYGKTADMNRVSDAEEIAGHGIRVLIDGKEILIGNGKLMRQQHIDYVSCKSSGTVVYVASEGVFAGAIVISDTVKDGAEEAIKRMKQAGVKKCVMLTGDRKEAAESVAAQLGIDEVYAELLPGDKVVKVEKLLENQRDKEKLAFAGDGINDAPVLTRADIGIAMGSMGSDAAIEAADVVLMDDDVRKIASTVHISRKTLRIVKQNIVFALGVKALVLALGAAGMANMWEAVFADVGVSVIAILNSMRALKTDDKE